MGKLINMEGQQFGQWSVLRQGTSTSNWNARWYCRCSCGNEVLVRGDKLRSGKSTKCNECRKKHYRYPFRKKKIMKKTKTIQLMIDNGEKEKIKCPICGSWVKEIGKDTYVCGQKHRHITDKLIVFEMLQVSSQQG